MNKEDAKKIALDYPIEKFLTLFTERARNKDFFICPVCNSGTGNNGHNTGALSVKDNKVTCFANECFRNNDIFDVTAEMYGLKKGSYEAFNKTYELIGIKVDDTNMSNREVPKKKVSNSNNTLHRFKDYILKCKADVEQSDYIKSRCLEKDIIDKFDLGYDKDKQQIIIPYNKEYTYYIARKITPLNPSDRYKKPKTEIAGQEPIFNEQALKKPSKKPIFCTEGQIDALSIIQAGYECIARGGTGTRLVQVLKENNFNGSIIIVPDNDVAGRKSAIELEHQLKENGFKCKIININGDYKDVNEFLVADKTEFYKRVKEAVEEILINLEQFHRFNNKGQPTGVIDKILADYIIDTQSIFIMGSTPYIYTDGFYIVDYNGTRLKEHIQKHIYTDLININLVNRIYGLIISSHRIQKKFDELNNYPNHWINFKNGMFDVQEWKKIEHSPKYYSINQVPHNLNIDEVPKGDNIEQFLNFAISDKEDHEMLLQFFGYCMTMDTTQQKFLILKGQGGTGKSLIIKMLENMLGLNNCSNISMQDLNKRFYPFSLLGKLLNSCADIPSEAMNSVDTIKKIVGEDILMGEQKGKDSISFKSYAKLLFSANEIPMNLEEKTQAFYRRLLILKVDRKPDKIDTRLEEKLLSEKDYLILESLKALRRMYKSGKIQESYNSSQEVLELYKDADTVTAYIEECLIKDNSKSIKSTELYKVYESYCNDNERTALTRHSFFKNLRSKGYITKTIKGYPYYIGLGFNNDFVPIDSKMKLPFD